MKEEQIFLLLVKPQELNRSKRDGDETKRRRRRTAFFFFYLASLECSIYCAYKSGVEKHILLTTGHI